MAYITSDTNTLFLPLKSYTDEQFASIRQRGLTNAWPQVFYDNGNYPLRTISVWPIPSQENAVELWLWEPLGLYADLDEELNLPQGYERFLRFRLAVELGAEFGKEVSPEVQVIAKEAEANIKRMNQQIPVAQLSKSLSRRGRKTTYVDFISSSDTLPEA